MAKLNLVGAHLVTDWRSQDLIDALPAAVYVCNADAVVVSYNRRAAELWGREPVAGDTDEKYCGSHRLFHPDGTFLPHHETPMARVLRTGEPARDQEVVIERPDGSRITVLVYIAPLVDEAGALVGAVNCFQDLTAQKRAERERARAAEELHQARKVEALGQLTAGVVHDFNNLLSAILGNLEVLKERTNEPAARKLLDSAIRAARRGATLNRQLLGFAYQRKTSPEAVYLNRLIADMGDLLHLTVGDMIGINQRTAPDAWPALADANRIELVILNLVINARDAMPAGGTLTIATRNATHVAGDAPLELSAGDYAVLAISDTGTGMSEQVRAQAFEPFFTTKEPGKGSGLGLSTALDVARQYGGGARIDSRLGEGTLIEFYLPRAAQPAAANEETGGAAGPTTVLLVDDDSEVRNITAIMLDSLGYRVVEATNGPAALAILSAEQVDLMLVDVAMPRMNGAETARLAREHQPALPVLFSTGYVDIEQFGLREIDADHLVKKPFGLDDLSRKIRACLNRRDSGSA